MVKTPETIGARAKEVRTDARKTQTEIADFLGLAIGTWQKMERDEVLPTGETLMQFKKLGVNPGWVLTGLGPKSLKEDESYLYLKNAIVDADLMLDIKEIIVRLHREGGITLKEDDRDRKIIQHYNEYMAADTDMSDFDEIKLWLEMLEKRVKREVTAAVKAPGTGKRSAS